MKTTISTLALFAVAVTGCSGGLARRNDPAAQRYRNYAEAPVDGFDVIHLDGWTPVSRSQLVVWNGPSEAYLLTVWDTCHELLFANKIGVTSTTRRVSHFETVLVDGNHCPITVIRPIDVKRMREDQREAHPVPQAS